MARKRIKKFWQELNDNLEKSLSGINVRKRWPGYKWYRPLWWGVLIIALLSLLPMITTYGLSAHEYYVCEHEFCTHPDYDSYCGLLDSSADCVDQYVSRGWTRGTPPPEKYEQWPKGFLIMIAGAFLLNTSLNGLGVGKK